MLNPLNIIDNELQGEVKVHNPTHVKTIKVALNCMIYLYLDCFESLFPHRSNGTCC